eukprot:TRINITY_DN32387_c0_g1_i1.p1 TRINITY_DN32387_c0_g1~~TRINITY_DN32387_c0_g1_i1.p1  ORF type:complete len:426 (+),score=85.66 TRINITY_DN32387_c0_g1_i1:117-1394(+)
MQAQAPKKSRPNGLASWGGFAVPPSMPAPPPGTEVVVAAAAAPAFTKANGRPRDRHFALPDAGVVTANLEGTCDAQASQAEQLLPEPSKAPRPEPNVGEMATGLTSAAPPRRAVRGKPRRTLAGQCSRDASVGGETTSLADATPRESTSQVTAQICASTSLEALSSINLPFSGDSVQWPCCPTCSAHCLDQMRCRQRAEQLAYRSNELGPSEEQLASWKLRAQPDHIRTWMVWMVHRVALDDPTLTRLDFACFSVPPSEIEPRILPKLFEALGQNSHLEEMMLGNTGLLSEKETVLALANALKVNRVLRKLDIQANFLEMSDLKVVLESLAENTALEELKVNNQACEHGDFSQLLLQQVGTEVYKAATETFRSNHTLQKLDLLLLQRHWRDQICKFIGRNVEERRKLRRRAQRSTSITITSSFDC